MVVPRIAYEGTKQLHDLKSLGTKGIKYMKNFALIKSNI